MKHIFKVILLIFFATGALKLQALEEVINAQLFDLENYKVDSAQMVSSGLPNREHFETLKAMGVKKVVDLIPGDRTEESKLMDFLELQYHNIQVEWENPTVENFAEYAAIMQQNNLSPGITLTHCRLNFRGAVFTYLYRITQLSESEELAKQDLLSIWEPNEIWLEFMAKVKAKY